MNSKTKSIAIYRLLSYLDKNQKLCNLIEKLVMIYIVWNIEAIFNHVSTNFLHEILFSYSLLTCVYIS